MASVRVEGIGLERDLLHANFVGSQGAEHGARLTKRGRIIQARKGFQFGRLVRKHVSPIWKPDPRHGARDPEKETTRAKVRQSNVPSQGSRLREDGKSWSISGICVSTDSLLDYPNWGKSPPSASLKPTRPPSTLLLSTAGARFGTTSALTSMSTASGSIGPRRHLSDDLLIGRDVAHNKLWEVRTDELPMVTAALLIGLLEVSLACLVVYGLVRAIGPICAVPSQS